MCQIAVFAKRSLRKRCRVIFMHVLFGIRGRRSIVHLVDLDLPLQLNLQLHVNQHNRNTGANPVPDCKAAEL